MKHIKTAASARGSKKRRSVSGLLNIMARLRDPSGCPWDKEQTTQTLKKFLLEEVYEVLEAIETGTPESLKEELGDLLLQIVFLSRIAQEEGKFDFFDVVHTLSEKLIRRHPHVFRHAGGSTMMPKNAQDVVKVWGAAKASEGKGAQGTSLLDDLPLALPALERAQKISQRVSQVGFDWPTIDAVWQKIQEELTELKRATRSSSRKAVEEELGDLLFTLVNWARFKNISAEEALRKATRRFSKRFRGVELELRRRRKVFGESTLEEMDHIWTLVKNTEKKKRRTRQ